MWNHRRPLRSLSLATLVSALAGAASAQALDTSPSLYLQASQARHGTDAWTLGLTLPWGTWSDSLWGGELRGHWDLWASQWSAEGPTGRAHTTVVGLSPTLRLRPDEGRSAWFVEGSVGPTYADRLYVTDRKAFSTRFNFASHLGVGLNWGVRRQHELVLRLQHVSNADIKKPNPGENFVQLRYALHF